MSISDRILLMKEGVLQQYSTPQEMYRDPANLFVASFLGNPPINKLPCTLEGTRITAGAGLSWEREALAPVLCGQPGTQAILGVRPEDVLVVERGEHLTAEVTAIQTLGKEVYLRLHQGDAALTACLSWDHDYRTGDRLKLKLRKCYLFPAEGGV